MMRLRAFKECFEGVRDLFGCKKEREYPRVLKRFILKELERTKISGVSNNMFGFEGDIIDKVAGITDIRDTSYCLSLLSPDEKKYLIRRVLRSETLFYRINPLVRRKIMKKIFDEEAFSDEENEFLSKFSLSYIIGC